MKFTRKIFFIVILFFGLCASGCGQKGPLYLPEGQQVQ